MSPTTPKKSAGIFTGMFSFPNPDEVFEQLGDKVLQAFSDALVEARSDYEKFRTRFASWMPEASQRAIASLIHDRIWAAMVRGVDDLPNVKIVDAEPTRQIVVNGNCVVRIKRHSVGENISSYPTKGAREFWGNRSVIPSMESVNLAMGYIWDADERIIGDAVLSFREGMSNTIWCVKLDAGVGATQIGWTPLEPEMPELDFSEFIEEQEPESQ